MNSDLHANDSKRVPISVLIPVKNEVRNLGQCLQALQGWADEIVVVDSQSTDGTIELAEGRGAQVIQFHYRGGWPKKRQWALDTHAWRNDWILLLDADETPTMAIKQEIESAIQDSEYDGYWLRFRLVFLGRALRFGDTEHRKLFLFRRGLGRFEQRLASQDSSMADMEVHEHVIVDGRVGQLNGSVRHENMNSLDRYISKHNEYSNWEAHVLLYGGDDELPPSLLGNKAQRRRWLKRNALWIPGSPLLRFLYVYIARLGFLDGRPGLIYSLFKLIQTIHVKAKIHELRTKQRDSTQPAVEDEQSADQEQEVYSKIESWDLPAETSSRTPSDNGDQGNGGETGLVDVKSITRTQSAE